MVAVPPVNTLLQQIRAKIKIVVGDESLQSRGFSTARRVIVSVGFDVSFEMTPSVIFPPLLSNIVLFLLAHGSWILLKRGIFVSKY